MFVEDGSHEVVGRCVTNVEFESGVKRTQIDQIGSAEVSRFDGRLRGECFSAELLDGLDWIDAKSFAFIGAERAAFEDHASQAGFDSPAVGISLEHQSFAGIESLVFRKSEDVRRDFPKGVDVEPLDEGMEAALFLEDKEYIVVPTVLADETLPLLRYRGGLGVIDASVGIVADLNTAVIVD